jgi:hypothetical protein
MVQEYYAIESNFSADWTVFLRYIRAKNGLFEVFRLEDPLSTQEVVTDSLEKALQNYGKFLQKCVIPPTMAEYSFEKLRLPREEREAKYGVSVQDQPLKGGGPISDTLRQDDVDSLLAAKHAEISTFSILLTNGSCVDPQAFEEWMSMDVLRHFKVIRAKAILNVSDCVEKYVMLGRNFSIESNHTAPWGVHLSKACHWQLGESHISKVVLVGQKLDHSWLEQRFRDNVLQKGIVYKSPTLESALVAPPPGLSPTQAPEFVSCADSSSEKTDRASIISFLSLLPSTHASSQSPTEAPAVPSIPTMCSVYSQLPVKSVPESFRPRQHLLSAGQQLKDESLSMRAKRLFSGIKRQGATEGTSSDVSTPVWILQILDYLLL